MWENKYGMIPKNFNRRKNVAMEHNVRRYISVADYEAQNYQISNNIKYENK